MTIVKEWSSMKKIAAGSFKTHCLALMDEVHSKRETIVITKRGEPIAKLVPFGKSTDDIFGFFVGKGAITGDIVSPALSKKEWGSLK
jgi:prevent-host-death family protein